MAAGNGRKRVAFSYHAPEASEVFLCGTFNGWSVDRTPMRRDALGGWKAQLMLPPGAYEYRLRVDGAWTDDPAAERRVPNTFGTWNCVREVSADERES